MLRQGATRIVHRSGYNYINQTNISHRGFRVAAHQRITSNTLRPTNNKFPLNSKFSSTQQRSLSLWPFSKSLSTPSTTTASSTISNDTLPGSATSSPPLSSLANDTSITAATSSPSPTTEESLSSISSSITSTSPVPEDYISASQSLIDLDLGHGIFTGTAQKILCAFHDVLPSLPWWATLTIAILGVRAAMLPIVVWAQRANASFARIQPQFQSLIDEINVAKKERNLERTQLLQLKASKMLKDNNANPARSLLLPIVQISTFLPFFFAVRGMAEAHFPLFAVGGFSWFTDLTVPDPLYILPITSLLSTALVLEFGMDGNGANKQAKMMKPIFRIVLLASGYYISSFPAAILVYWTASNTFTLIQTFSFKLKAVKSALGLPDPPPPPPPKLDAFGKPEQDGGFIDGLKKSYNAMVVEDAKNRQDHGKVYGIHQPPPPPPSSNKPS